MVPDSPLASAVLSYVMESAPVLALTVDADGSVRTANAYARRTLGPHVMGRPLSALVVEFTPLPDLSTLLLGGDASYTLSLKTAAALPESFQFRFIALPDGILALGSLDVAEQARLRNEVLGLNRELNDLTRQLQQANAELRELDQLKNQFLGMAAHDLRRPVGIVMTYGEFVLDEAGDRLSEQQREFLRTCLAAAAGMKQLIDSFLDVSVIESGKLQLELAPVRASDILRAAEPIARVIAAKRQVTLLLDDTADTRRLQADTSKVQQVLLNLIGNAVEHSAPGGRVWVSTRSEVGFLVFTVRDEGPGLTPEDQARIFTAFERVGTRRTAGERRIGLGLAIARKVVEAHGGRIGVESIPGQGATFRVSLPSTADASTSLLSSLEPEASEHPMPAAPREVLPALHDAHGRERTVLGASASHPEIS